MRFSRHDNLLRLTGRVVDPVYLTEPMYVSKQWRLGNNLAGANRSAGTCTVTFEGVPTGQVQHYLPGQNPNVDEISFDSSVQYSVPASSAYAMWPSA